MWQRVSRMVRGVLVVALALGAVSGWAQRVEVLDNGLRIVVQENHTAPVAALRIYVATGSIYEQEYLGMGISHVFEHLISGGTTTTRTEAQIADLLDRLGGASNAYTHLAHTCYHLTTDAGKVGDAIDLMADWMRNCTFPQPEVDRELGVVLEELRKGKEEPSRILSEALHETMFQVHPVRVPIIGYEELVQQITRDDIVRYYQRMYVPNNMIVVVAGDFDGDAVLARVKAAFGPMPRRPLPAVVLPAEPPQLGLRERTVYRPGLGGGYAFAAFHTIPLQHPDLYALDVLSHILSNGPSSRLVRLLREEHRLVNSIDTFSSTPEYGAGMFAIHLVAPDDRLDTAVTAALDELYRTRQEPVADDELAKAKRQKLAEDVLGKQSVDDEAAELGLNLLTTGNVHFSEHYLAGIQQVTAADIQRVANTYFRPENLTIVRLRPEPPAAAAPAAAATATTATAIRKVVLPNGLRLLVKRNPNLPLVNLQAVFYGGVRLEPAGQAGVSRLAATMLTRGTATRTRQQLADAFDRMGGSLSPSSGNNTLGLAAEVLKDDFPEALALFADSLLNPAFPEAEFTTVQGNQLAALGRLNDSWDSELANLFRRAYYTQHPYANHTLGTPETVKTLTPAQAREFYQQMVVPERGVVTVFGDVDEDAVIAAVTAALGQFTRTATPPPAPAPQPPITEAKIVNHATTRQLGAVYFGYPGTTIGDTTDLPALTVLDSVLSGIGFPGGRLHEHLRGGTQDLVYLVHAFNVLGLEPGYFGIQAASSPDKLDKVIEVILKDVNDLRTTLVPAAELDKAKQICITMENLSRQTNADTAQQAALDELFGLGYDHSSKYAPAIQAVTAEEVQRVAQKYLTHYVLLRTGPPPKP